jgi:hypothetical protein
MISYLSFEAGKEKSEGGTWHMEIGAQETIMTKAPMKYFFGAGK